MPFCGNCGAQKADINAQCSQCGGDAAQYYQPMPYYPPQRHNPDEDVGKALGIIAIIILVVIIVTVVLAAVLYVMVIGFSTGGFISTPVGTWNSMEAISSTSAVLTFGYFSDDVVPTNLQIIVREEGTSAGNIFWTGDTSSTTVDMNWINGPTGAYAEGIKHVMPPGAIEVTNLRTSFADPNSDGIPPVSGPNHETEFCGWLYWD